MELAPESLQLRGTAGPEEKNREKKKNPKKKKKKYKKRKDQDPTHERKKKFVRNILPKPYNPDELYGQK
jgi:hypothetical protein